MFDFVGGIPFQTQPAIGASAWGTPGETSGTLATLKLKHNAPATAVNFECTIHKQNMAGVLRIGGIPPTDPAETTRAINYRTEPFAYRFLNPNYLDNTSTLSTTGVARSQSNSLVASEPQTPVFVAEAGKPLRIRMLHPGGLNEQVFDLHGHAWQEEPFSNNSTSLTDNNPTSQWTGSRDTFGPNSAFDVLLSRAGGRNAVQGDYLFRTYMQTDFLQGMWGIVRVGPVGKDVITLTQFCGPPSMPLFTIAGSNTINPATHHMAANVTISGLGAPATAPVDPLTGAWIFQSATATPPASITVTSPGGGKITQNGVVCPIQQNQIAAPVPPPTPAENVEILRFKPAVPLVSEPGDKATPGAKTSNPSPVEKAPAEKPPATAPAPTMQMNH